MFLLVGQLNISFAPRGGNLNKPKFKRPGVALGVDVEASI